MSDQPLLVDARGLLCPWPVLRLSRAARALGTQGQIRIVADDPAASREIASLCTERGWALSADPAEKDAFLVALNGHR